MSISFTRTSVSLDDLGDELTVEIYPHPGGKDIAEIDGKYGNMKCTLKESELATLPLILKGSGGHLADKIRTNISGHVDANGNFQIFVSSLATTLVQFKLMGKVFPESGLHLNKFTPEILNYACLKKLSKLANGNKRMSAWVEKMVKFWNQWKFMFQEIDGKHAVRSLLEKQAEDISAIKRNLEDIESAVKTVRSNADIVSAEVTSLRKDVEALRVLVIALYTK
jgi:hypothetical protein